MSLTIVPITGCGDVSDDPAAQTPEQEVVSTESVSYTHLTLPTKRIV